MQCMYERDNRHAGRAAGTGAALPTFLPLLSVLFSLLRACHAALFRLLAP